MQIDHIIIYIFLLPCRERERERVVACHMLNGHGSIDSSKAMLLKYANHLFVHEFVAQKILPTHCKCSFTLYFSNRLSLPLVHLTQVSLPPSHSWCFSPALHFAQELVSP